MQTISEVVATPCYVLMDGKTRLGPSVDPPQPGDQVSVIYGFSDKPPYDKFCSESQLALHPYPLVQGYLQTQILASATSLGLVVLDAAGPRAPVLHAATLAAVLEAQRSRAPQLTATHLLRFDPEANVYRLESAAA